MGILSNSDVYINDNNPTTDINPKTVGALWINYKTGTQFTCSDNTKNKNVWKSNWESTYPIGSCYITINDDIDPNVVFGGKWRLEGGDRALWSSSNGGGSYIPAGLPNITGQFGFVEMCDGKFKNGCFETSYWQYANAENHNKYEGGVVTMDASKSNPIYGNSTTVQPPAIKVYVWIREQ